jgi:hypothetical protein
MVAWLFLFGEERVMKLNQKIIIVTIISTWSIALFSFPVWGTDVGGIIDTDTTWDLAGSPYNIISDIQIAEGVTLTMEPGVVVNNGGGRIRVWGALEAIGTSSSKITLNNVMLDEYASTIINIHFAEINSGWYFFSHAGGSFALLDSKIKNTQFIQADICSNDSFIERNIFIDAGEVYVERDGANVYIKNNVFYQHTSLSVSGNNAVVEYNSFLSTDRVALLLRTSSTSNFAAANNYWNTSNTSVIDSMIYDRNDDLSIPYYVEYIPFLTEPHPDTPIPDFNQAPTSNSGANQVVFDEVTLDGSASYDSDGTISTYEWSLQHEDGSNISASGPNPTISDLHLGFYDVYLTVTDNGGLVDVDSMVLAAAGPCPVSPVPDVDGDGEADLTDLCPETPPNTAVDSNGCSLVQFCSGIDMSVKHGQNVCNRSDWKNDEPLENKGNCEAIKEGQGGTNYRCIPR